jgi:hypothetical protein
VAADRHNCWSKVADYPRYGSGVDGWRDTLVADTTARAKQVVPGEGLYSWLLQYARARVPVSELQCELPDPL